MHPTLSLWRVDHANFAKLLHLLEEQLDLFHEGGSPQYELMLDIMYYMTRYCDVLHHPKEDLVFAKIRQRQRSARAKIAALLKQHGELKACGERLARDLDDIVNGSIAPRERIESDGRRYITDLRDHMRSEESEVLPLAGQLLNDKDWAEIDEAIRHFEDPLFGSKVADRYAALRKQIAREVSVSRETAR